MRTYFYGFYFSSLPSSARFLEPDTPQGEKIFSYKNL